MSIEKVNQEWVTPEYQYYSTKSLQPIFDNHIKNDAEVLADGCSGYRLIKEDYPNLKQTLSNQEKNFKMLHILNRNFKNWLRGVHSYYNKEYGVSTFDETILLSP